MKLTILLLISLAFFSCNKVNEYATQVANQPSLATGEYGVFAYGITNWEYPSTVVVGDTIEFIGKLFMDQGKTTIRIGDTTARLLWYTDLSGSGESAIQLVKTVVTAGMGIGVNRPVTVTANGASIQGPPITIEQFNFLEQTDTTLWVSQYGSNWFPDNLSYFQTNQIPLVMSTNTALNGTVCFANPLGVYTLTAAGVQPQVVHGTVLQENGTTYSIDQVVGSAISADGNTLYVSASVLENNPDTVGELIFRLFSMSPGTPSTASTINRTEVPINGTTNEKVTAFEGAAAGLKLVAMSIQTDTKGNLYFTNIYPPQQTGVNAITGTYGQGWYYQIQQGYASTEGSPLSGLNNMCSLSSSGQVKSILTNSFGGLSTPGYPVNIMIYTVDETGSNVYTYNVESNGLTVDLVQYSLTLHALVSVTPSQTTGFTFISYDTSAQTGQYFAPGTFMGPYFGGIYENMLVLPNGVLVSVGYESLMGIILSEKVGYCYAGTEQGLQNFQSQQTQVTGKAKWVNFYNIIDGSASGIAVGGGFAGLDQAGSIYYYGGANDYVNGAVFYKLYSRK